MDFVKKFAERFPIGPNNVQIGVTLFSSFPETMFHMNEHTDINSLKNAIDQIAFRGG